MIRAFEIFERFGRNVLQVFLLDLLGTWLDGQTKNGGVEQIAQSYQKEQESGKGQDGIERLGCFQTFLLTSALRAGASWVLFSGPGRLSYSFLPFHTSTMRQHGKLCLQINSTPLHESWQEVQ
jgi:hypothetical protein